MANMVALGWRGLSGNSAAIRWTKPSGEGFRAGAKFDP
jgi:hypothetical protein